jgi:hypothetical protein
MANVRKVCKCHVSPRFSLKQIFSHKNTFKKSEIKLAVRVKNIAGKQVEVTHGRKFGQLAKSFMHTESNFLSSLLSNLSSAF